eukprot:CAMPEP_0194268846 /NCGR_PEP_ID=MMETSP0169-20130528/3108_1 /TAXON_ID=218684 /ORGANISM="Corethron pennatum, Strain L29A3" /LENGTH=60 /DNA_ID=CAMNT_0039010251 /DNA_START=151 /DNA_END=333 /DNA_ORIENTATION=-
MEPVSSFFIALAVSAATSLSIDSKFPIEMQNNSIENEGIEGSFEVTIEHFEKFCRNSSSM